MSKYLTVKYSLVSFQASINLSLTERVVALNAPKSPKLNLVRPKVYSTWFTMDL